MTVHVVILSLHIVISECKVGAYNLNRSAGFINFRVTKRLI